MNIDLPPGGLRTAVIGVSDVSTSIELLQSWFPGLRQLQLHRVINTEDLDDGGLCGRAVPAVSHPGLKGSGPSGHEQTSASHRPTGEKRSQEPPGDPTPMHCHRNTPNQRPNALTHGSHGRMSLPSRDAVGLQRVQRANAVWGSKAVHSDFKGMERLRLGVVPVRPSPRVAEKSGRRPSRAHPPQNRRRSESLRSRQASPLDPDAGFTVQCINADHAVNNGDRIFGYKLATSPQAGGLAVGRAVAHPVFRRSRRRWCCAGGHGVQPIVWCGICPQVIRHQSQN